MAITLPEPLNRTVETLDDRADIWLLPEEVVDRFTAPLGGLAALTPQERERHDRLISEASRRRFLGARLLARRVLSQYADVPLDAWSFSTGKYGRPEIEGATWGLDFNLTHTNGLIAAIVVRNMRCGLDVEETPARREAVNLSAKVLTPLENQVLHQHPAEQVGHAFAESWVAKEAYTKATGMGMCRGFDAFSVHLLRDGSFALVDEEIPVDERPLWQVEVLQVWDRFALGVAIRHSAAQPGPVPVRLRSALAELLPRGAAAPALSEPGLAWT